jgi:hypothetical protein
MRRTLEIRVAFTPTRLSAEYLRAAYEVVTPTIERTIVAEETAPGIAQDEKVVTAHVRGPR